MLRIDRIRRVLRTSLENAPPVGRGFFDALAPTAIGLALQVRKQHPKRFRRIADEIQLRRISNTEHSTIDVDLDSSCLSWLREKLWIGKIRPDHQQRVALLHQVPAWLGPEKTDRPGDERQIVGKYRLAQQRFCDASAERLRYFAHLVARAERARADEHRDATPAVQNVGGAAEIIVLGNDQWTTDADARVHGCVRMRRRCAG